MGLLKRHKDEPSQPTYAWTTDDELKYLKGIGSFVSADEPRTTKRKMNLLRNYLSAAKLRVDWCGMDKGRIIDAARRHLASLEAQMA